MAISKMPYKSLTQQELNFVLSTTSPNSLKFNIESMNRMYRLPVNTEPSLDGLFTPKGEKELASVRIQKFLRVLRDECAEGDIDTDKNPSILTKLMMIENNDFSFWDGLPDEANKDILVDLADWFADIIVYCRSEAMKFGLPLEEVLEAVQGSNATKLPADGIPIHDADGKFQKDLTRFIPPEPAIKSILWGLREE
jgi:hypothetical protein